MRILVAGASGAVGKRLVPRLVAAGHHVMATTRTPEKLGRLREQGADAVVMDGLDEESVRKAVVGSRPEVIVHEMTALASMGNLRRFDHEFAMTNRLRTEGTKHLLAAGQAAGAGRFVAQSYAGWTTGPGGRRVKTEDDPFDPDPPRAMARTLDAIRALERMVLDAPGLVGIVLRYGSLYGPGTSLAEGAQVVEMVRRRRLPLIGSGAGVWSFIHVDDAARATQRAIESGASGVYNIVDDEPAEVHEWLPDLARAIGARPPRHVPTWVGRMVVGTAGVSMMTRVRGCSNAKAKETLGWQPTYATWQDGFRRGLSEEPSRDLDEEGHPDDVRVR
jgi:nucleoside-diphosphate-sugar epimerase